MCGGTQLRTIALSILWPARSLAAPSGEDQVRSVQGPPTSIVRKFWARGHHLRTSAELLILWGFIVSNCRSSHYIVVLLAELLVISGALALLLILVYTAWALWKMEPAEGHGFLSIEECCGHLGVASSGSRRM